jgi:hypothetical protein
MPQVNTCKYAEHMQICSTRIVACRFISLGDPQHDPKKLEFVYNLRSRRPGAASVMQGLKHLARIAFALQGLIPEKMAVPRLPLKDALPLADGFHRLW